jgi:hypothetical protein
MKTREQIIHGIARLQEKRRACTPDGIGWREFNSGMKALAWAVDECDFEVEGESVLGVLFASGCEAAEEQP